MAEPAKEDTAFPDGLAHHFMQGLRFDGLWRYAVRMEPGSLQWEELPLESEDFPRKSAGDPDGAWWCVRRCVAVLGQQAWILVRPPRHLQSRPSVAQVVQILHLLRSEWTLRVGQGDAQTPTQAVSHAIGQGGCALVRLVLLHQRQHFVCWTWVVGVEVQAQSGDRALLVAGPQWPAPWGCGYGARLMADAQGVWELRGTDGQRLLCKKMEMVVLMPEQTP